MYVKRQEDQNPFIKKISRNTKQKSIDNSIYNQNNIYLNASMNFHNPPKNQKKVLKNVKNSGNKNSSNNIFTFKETTKNSFNKNNLNIITNNIKNTQYQKTQNLTTNSNYSLFSFSNIVNEPTLSN